MFLETEQLSGPLNHMRWPTRRHTGNDSQMSQWILANSSRSANRCPAAVAPRRAVLKLCLVPTIIVPERGSDNDCSPLSLAGATKGDGKTTIQFDSYDELNRPTKKSYPGTGGGATAPAVQYCYDGKTTTGCGTGTLRLLARAMLRFNQHLQWPSRGLHYTLTEQRDAIVFVGDDVHVAGRAEYGGDGVGG